MKQFLRYQISGSVFILWVIIFYVTGDYNGSVLVSNFRPYIGTINIFTLGLAIALPIGVLIHQLSVLLKNYVFGKVNQFNLSELSDYPDKIVINKFSDTAGKNNDKVNYCLERISNLNTFYYVRFDNGVLAPFLSIIFTYMVLNTSIRPQFLFACVAIGFITIAYIKRIPAEIIIYKDIIRDHPKKLCL